MFGGLTYGRIPLFSPPSNVVTPQTARKISGGRFDCATANLRSTSGTKRILLRFVGGSLGSTDTLPPFPQKTRSCATAENWSRESRHLARFLVRRAGNAVYATSFQLADIAERPTMHARTASRSCSENSTVLLGQSTNHKAGWTPCLGQRSSGDNHGPTRDYRWVTTATRCSRKGSSIVDCGDSPDLLGFLFSQWSSSVGLPACSHGVSLCAPLLLPCGSD